MTETEELRPNSTTIQTCDRCKHWKPTESDWGICQSMATRLETDTAGRSVTHTFAFFGCINWEQESNHYD